MAENKHPEASFETMVALNAFGEALSNLGIMFPKYKDDFDEFIFTLATKYFPKCNAPDCPACQATNAKDYIERMDRIEARQFDYITKETTVGEVTETVSQASIPPEYGIEYLGAMLQAASPVIPGQDFQEIRIAESQPEYETLAAIPIQGGQFLLSRWLLTRDDLERIQETRSIFLSQWTFGEPMQPIRLETVQPRVVKITNPQTESPSAEKDFGDALKQFGDNLEKASKSQEGESIGDDSGHNAETGGGAEKTGDQIGEA